MYMIIWVLRDIEANRMSPGLKCRKDGHNLWLKSKLQKGPQRVQKYQLRYKETVLQVTQIPGDYFNEKLKLCLF